MPRRLLAALASTAAAALLAPPQAVSGRAAAAEGPIDVAVKRPNVGLDRVLTQRHLAVHYVCFEACDPVMRLRVGGILISRFDPPGGPTAGIRVAVFPLGRGDRGAIRAHVHGGVARFHLRAVFTSPSATTTTRSLRFALRR